MSATAPAATTQDDATVTAELIRDELFGADAPLDGTLHSSARLIERLL
jgi:hypothetical protein